MSRIGGGGGGGGGGVALTTDRRITLALKCTSRNGPYIAAFILKLNCKQVYYVLKISLIIICVFHYMYIGIEHHLYKMGQLPRKLPHG